MQPVLRKAVSWSLKGSGLHHRTVLHRHHQQRQIWSMVSKGFGMFTKTKTISTNRPPLKPGKVAPKLPVPAHIQKPPYADSGNLPSWSSTPQVHNAEQLAKMRAACKLAAQTLEYAGTLVKAGVTTDEIDKAVHQFIIDHNAYPSPLNYGRFPKSVCTSVNECVCHGIPDDRPLQDGDIVNVDVTVYLDGYHGDNSKMFYVGKVSPEAKKLCEVTYEATMAAIKVCAPGVSFAKIGNTIHDIADKHGFGVVRDYVGHGVGRVFHAYPHVKHYRNRDLGMIMQPWQTFTIEPMIVQGGIKTDLWKDDWTVVTADRGLAAQYEHTVLVTDTGYEILTLP